LVCKGGENETQANEISFYLNLLECKKYKKIVFGKIDISFSKMTSKLVFVLLVISIAALREFNLMKLASC
jgi:hypothetical protein